MERVKSSMAAIEAAIAKIDKVRANLDAALRRAEADIAALFATTAEPASPTPKRRASTLNPGNVSPTNGASAGPASAP